MAVGFAARDKAALSCGLSQPGIMFLTTVFTSVYILARPTGLHNLWPGTDLLEGQRKQPLPAGEGLFPGPAPRPGLRRAPWGAGISADGGVLPFVSCQSGKGAPREASCRVSVGLVSVLSP